MEGINGMSPEAEVEHLSEAYRSLRDEHLCLIEKLKGAGVMAYVPNPPGCPAGGTNELRLGEVSRLRNIIRYALDNMAKETSSGGVGYCACCHSIQWVSGSPGENRGHKDECIFVAGRDALRQAVEGE